MFQLYRKSTKRRKKKKLEWEAAGDIRIRIKYLVEKLELDWIEVESVYCVRSNHSSARAYARIWGLSRIWQETMGLPASYCIEVLSEKFDHLPQNKKDEILLHELAHIPKNFSGALVPHTHKRKGSFHDKLDGWLRAYNRL